MPVAHVESISLTFTTDTCSSTFATSVNVGDVIAIGAGGTDVPSLPTDNLGNTYVLDKTSTAQDGITCKTFYTRVTVPGSCTVSVFFGTGGNSEALATLISGCLLSGTVLDRSRINNQLAVGSTANAITSTDFTPALSKYFIFGFTYNTSLSGVSISAGTNVAFTAAASATRSKSEYFVQPVSGSMAAKFKAGTAGSNFTTAAMVFKQEPPAITASSGSYTSTGVAAALRFAAAMFLRYRK